MNDCASAGENQIRGCSLSRAIGAITPQHSQHLIIFVKKSVAIPTNLIES
ncbi:transposase, partial [Enterococcus faecium]